MGGGVDLDHGPGCRVVFMELSDVLKNVSVPSMAVGTMYFGSTVPGDVAHHVLDAARDRGATFWDTANNYAFWTPGGTGDESEECLGAWLAARGPSARDEVVLATKVGARPRPGGNDVTQGLGLSAPGVREQVLGSLRRLGTDYVDVLYAHIDDQAVPMVETLGAFADLQQEGLIRMIAASNLSAERLQEAVSTRPGTGYRALQQRFTYLIPDPSADVSPHVLLDEQVEHVCAESGMTMLGYSPLLSGAYTRTDRPLPDGYLTPATDHALTALHDAAKRAGLDAGQAVLAWMGQRERPVLPVVGVSTPEQLHCAVDAVTTPLPHDTLTRLDAARSRA